jgi:hypothetical protein
VSADGKIFILTLNTKGNVLYLSHITLQNNDLRVPKISITPDDDILLITYARQTSSSNQTIGSRNLMWLSQTGRSWSATEEFADSGWWLWRVN